MKNIFKRFKLNCKKENIYISDFIKILNNKNIETVTK